MEDAIWLHFVILKIAMHTIVKVAKLIFVKIIRHAGRQTISVKIVLLLCREVGFVLGKVV